MCKLKEITRFLDELAPGSLQEDYDNSGLIITHEQDLIRGILITLDVTEEVVDEAVSSDCNLIVSHHPVIFKGLKRLGPADHTGRAILKAVKNNIHIYSIHTNLDNVKNGVNGFIADRIGLTGTRVLLPRENVFRKIVTFCPRESTRKILDAIHQVGAGIIGNYEQCSFRVTGTGSFKPNERANPYIGKNQELEESPEDRIEIQFPNWLQDEVLQAMIRSHPYEEAAYYIQDTKNISWEFGAGIIGSLPVPSDPASFLSLVKEKLELKSVKFTQVSENKQILKVAACGGSGSFLLKKAMNSGADAFITADIKYHEFFETEGKILLLDIGHYESEKYTKDLLYGLLSEKFSNIALRLSKVDTNPVRYI
jgi:dinuclear metal center YbgI/SA1388 family protein